MREYVGYRIQKRDWSSNIIEAGYEENGKIKWIPYLAPLVSRQEGDALCEELIKYLKKH